MTYPDFELGKQHPNRDAAAVQWIMNNYRRARYWKSIADFNTTFYSDCLWHLRMVDTIMNRTMVSILAAPYLAHLSTTPWLIE